MNLFDFGADGFTLADALVVTTLGLALAGAAAKAGHVLYRIARKIDEINSSVNHVGCDDDPATVGKGIRELMKEFRADLQADRAERRADHNALVARIDAHLANHP